VGSYATLGIQTWGAVVAVGVSTSAEVRLTQAFSPIARIGAGVGGVAIVAIVIKDLWPGLWPLGWHSLLVAPIVAGGVALGGILLVAALVGDRTTWIVKDATIEIHRRSPWRRRTDIVPINTIAGIELQETEWESRAPSFGIAVDLFDGRRLLSPHCANRDAAEFLRDRLRARRATTV